MSEWFIELHGRFQPMQDWEQEAIEKAIASGIPEVVYTWEYENKADPLGPPKEVIYWILLKHLIQVNNDNDTAHRILRLETKTSHVKLGPYPENV